MTSLHPISFPRLSFEENRLSLRLAAHQNHYDNTWKEGRMQHQKYRIDLPSLDISLRSHSLRLHSTTYLIHIARRRCLARPSFCNPVSRNHYIVEYLPLETIEVHDVHYRLLSVANMLRLHCFGEHLSPADKIGLAQTATRCHPDRLLFDTNTQPLHNLEPAPCHIHSKGPN